MYRPLPRSCCLILLVFVSCCCSSVAESHSTSERLSVVQFQETEALIANPGQGWMTQRRAPGQEERFPYSVVYIRFNWADVEPEPGKYNWGIIDNVVNAWKSRGATVAFRVMTCNAHSAGYYSSPKWLFDVGCKGFEYTRGGDDPTSGGARIVRIEPDYADPIYLSRHGEFLAALGQRYDGSPDIEFLDIGSYGIWGEWHTSHPAAVEVRKRIVHLYLGAFEKTPLVFMSDDAEVLDYALSKGTGMRRDGVGSPWHERNWIGSAKYAEVRGMADTWRRAPVVFEWFGNYDYLKSKDWSFAAAVDFMLRNHVCLINDNIGAVPPEAVPELQKLARLAGARFVLHEFAHSSKVRPGADLHMLMRWSNVGVARLYRSYQLRLALLDEQGGIACSKVAESSPTEWLPGETRAEERLRIPPELQPGTYQIALSLPASDPRRRPFALAMEAPQRAGHYLVGTVQVLPK